MPTTQPARSATATNRPATLPATAQQGAAAESEAPCSSLLAGTFSPACTGIRNDGGRCRGRVSAGQEFCSFHRRDLQETVHAGRIQGARRRERPVTELDLRAATEISLNLDSRGGIQAGIDAILFQLLLGKISTSYASAAVRLFTAAIRNLDKTDRKSEDHTFDRYLSGLASIHRLSDEIASGRFIARPTDQDRLTPPLPQP